MSTDDLAGFSDLPVPAAPPIGTELEGLLGAIAPVAPRRPLRQLAILVGCSLVYGAGVLGVVTVRRDVAELPWSWIVGVGLAWCVGFVGAAYLATVPARGQIIPRWRAGALAAAVLAIGFMAFMLLADIPSGPHSLQFGWPRFFQGHPCLEIGLASALVPVIAGAIFLRGALPVGARWTAAALGASGGCLGGFVLHLHCPVTDHQHLGLIHGSVVIVAAALAAAIVPGRAR